MIESLQKGKLIYLQNIVIQKSAMDQMNSFLKVELGV